MEITKKDTKRRVRQRRNIIMWLLLVILSATILIRCMENRYNVRKKFVQNEEGAEYLANKINPNTATWASLARLPGIGAGKARAIIKYRRQYCEKNGSKKIPFKKDMDICKVKGIGEVTVEQIKEYLIFDKHKQASIDDANIE